MGQTIAAQFPIIVPWAKGTPNESTGQPTSVGGIEQVIDISSCINARITDRNDVVPIQIIGDDNHAANVAGANKIGFVGYDASGQERQVSGTVRYSGKGTGADGKLDIVFPGGIWSVAGDYTFYVFVEFTDGSRRTTNSLKFPIFGDQALAFVGGENYKDDFQKKLDTLLALPDWQALNTKLDDLSQRTSAASDKLSAVEIALKQNADLPFLSKSNIFAQTQTAPDFLTSDGGKLSDWQNFNKARKITYYGREGFSLANNVAAVDGATPEIVSIENDQYIDTSISTHVYFTQALKAGAITQVFTLPDNLAIDSLTATNGTDATFMNGVVCHIFVQNHAAYIYPYGDVPMTYSTGTNQLVINLRAIWKK